MIYDCKFNPSRDIEQCVPSLSTDLCAAMESGVVIDSGTLCDFNNIETPSSIVGRVRDAFDAIDMQRSIKSRIASASAQVLSSDTSIQTSE